MQLTQRIVELKNVWFALQNHIAESYDEASESESWQTEFSEMGKEVDNPSDQLEDEESFDDEGNSSEEVMVSVYNKNETRRESVKNRDSVKRQTEGCSSKRSKKPCPYPTCKSKAVINLSRHLKDVHNWLPEKARTAVGRFNLRKEYGFHNKNAKQLEKQKKAAIKRKQAKIKPWPSARKDYHRKRYCPIPGCFSVSKRLDKHLKRVHKITSEKRYLDLLAGAKRVSTDTTPAFHYSDQKPHKSKNSSPVNSESKVEITKTLDDPGELEIEDDIGTADGTQTEECDRNDATAEILEEFRIWMESPDGGKKDSKTSNQHKRQLAKISQTIGDGARSLLNFKLLRNKFILQYCESERKFQPQTVQSYLMSIRHFLSFLIADEPKGLDFEKNDILSLRERFERWSSAYQKKNNLRRWERAEEDLRNLVTSETIRKFERSEAARNAIVLLGKISDEREPIAQQDFTLIRDFLQAEILIDNAHRPGVIAHLTMEEFSAAVKEKESYTVSVRDHKTANVYGPATVVLSDKLFRWLNVYVEKVRPQADGLENGPNSRVFITFSGNGMTSSQITKCVKSIFKKAESSVLPSATIMRKSAVTNARENAQHLSGELADLMMHQEKTADKYYKLRKRSKVAVSASKELSKLMRKETQETEELPSTSEDWKERIERTMSIQEGSQEDNIDSNSLSDGSCVAPTESYKSSSTFNTQESEMLAELFGDMIKNVPIAKEVVKKTLNESRKGKQLLQRFTVFQIVNRLKYLRRVRRQKAEVEAMQM